MEVLQWTTVKEYEDITYQKSEGVARIAFNRPEVRNAFRPQTIDEMVEAFNHVWQDQQVGTILLTGNGPAKDGKYAFCSGGDQRVRGHGGYVDNAGVARLNVLQLQRILRSNREVTHNVQHMTAANCIASHQRNYRLWYRANNALKLQHI